MTTCQTSLTTFLLISHVFQMCHGHHLPQILTNLVVEKHQDLQPPVVLLNLSTLAFLSGFCPSFCVRCDRLNLLITRKGRLMTRRHHPLLSALLQRLLQRLRVNHCPKDHHHRHLNRYHSCRKHPRFLEELLF